MRPVPELGDVIADFLGEAEAGTVRGAGATPYTRAQLRELRGALTHVSSELGAFDAAAVRNRDIGELVDRLDAAGLSEERIASILHALRLVYAYAIERGIVTTSPLVGLGLNSAAPGQESPSPTTAMLQFGERVATWTSRLLVVTFVLAAVGLAVALV